MITHFRRDIEKVELVPASGGIFEVTVNGTKIYSKDETGVFPDTQDVINTIESM